MSDPTQDLRATGDSIREDAARVDDLEREKASLEPGDPQLEHLSRQVESVVDRMQVKAAAETELAAEVETTTEKGLAGAPGFEPGTP